MERRRKILALAGSATHLALCLALPAAGFVWTSWVELSGGGWAPEASSTAAFVSALWLLGLLGSGLSLHWSLWGRAPRLLRWHARCWAPLYALAGLALLGLGMGLRTGDPLADLAAFLVIWGSLGLFGSALAGGALALVIWLASRGRSA